MRTVALPLPLSFAGRAPSVRQTPHAAHEQDAAHRSAVR
jgi:hypothetical protein